MSYNQEESKKTVSESVPRLEDGQVGIRATLNKMGFSNDRIGFNETDGTVTLDNRTLMKPGYLDETAGVSYAPEKEIQQHLVNFYQNTSDPVVRVSDAFANSAGKYGISADSLTYGNGTVAIGGKPLEILYIDDEGKSWAYRSKVDDATQDLASRQNLKDPASLAETYRRRYLENAVNLAEELSYQKPFSYDPNEDPVYQAYRNKYLTEGNRASRDSLASYASLTGGYTNSAAATAAAQAELYYNQQLTDKIPELAELAYQRYSDQYRNNLSLLDSMIDIYDTSYRNAAEANAAQVKNTNLSASSSTERDRENTERARENLDRSWEDMFRQQKYAAGEQAAEKDSLTMEGLRLDNLQQSIYQKYYEQLLEAELAGKRIGNQLTQAKIYQAYNN